MPLKATIHLLLACLLATAGSATEWTTDDLVLADRLSDATLSRDGRLLAWVQSEVRTVDGELKRVSSLWLERPGSKAFQLTRGNDGVSSPRFSPDGRWLAFLSARVAPDPGDAQGDQVWVIATDGGEARRVTEFDRQVRDFRWRDDLRLVVLADEAASLWRQQRDEGADTSKAVDDAENTPPRRLWEVGLDNGKARPLTRNNDWISWFEVSPDGRRAFVSAQRSLSYEFDQLITPRTFLVDLSSGAEDPLFDGQRPIPMQAEWATDGSGVYFVARHSRHPVYEQATVFRLHFVELGEGSERSPQWIDLDWPRELARTLTVTEGGVLALLADGVYRQLARVTRSGDGWQVSRLVGEHLPYIDAITVSADGSRVTYEHSRSSLPTQLYSAALTNTGLESAVQVSELNPGYADKPQPRTEILQWTGALGETVEGILLYPYDWTEGEARPLVVQIHGGPAGVDRDTWDPSWSRPIPLFLQRGAFVLRVNYHGSAGYGLDWLDSISGGKAYDLEYPDIEAGVDHVIALGLADPDRLGVTGWSYGGIMAADMITKNRRYKVAQIGAADVEWISDWANVDFGAAYDNYYFGGTPWEIPEVYIDKSPFFKLPEVTTPTLIFTGTEDRNVPPHQSWSLFRGLQQQTTTPTKLVLFPGEPHGLIKIAHQRRKIDEEMAWFDRYLFQTEADDRRSLKKQSPLAALLYRRAAETTDGMLGRRQGDVLVPETATFKGIEVGRFEVTRHQYASLTPGYEFAHGQGNLPVTGISLAEARSWAARLAEATGAAFRLPTIAEAQSMAEEAGGGGNTLDRWAGYQANPEDAAQLRSLAADLGPGSLLQPVGSLPGHGEPPIFDLDGNAAEWAIGAEGQAMVVGASADQAESNASATVNIDYIGFRIVVDR